MLGGGCKRFTEVLGDTKITLRTTAVAIELIFGILEY